jgi:hypothetical protein
VLAQLDTAFSNLDAAYKTGDPVKIGQAEAEIKRLSEQYQRLRSTSPPTSTPSPTK